MTDTEFEILKADEAKAYAQYDRVNSLRSELGDKWLPLKQALDREKVRREIAAEMLSEALKPK